MQPGPGWLSGLGIAPKSKGSPVGLPVRAPALGCGLGLPSRPLVGARLRGNRSVLLSHIEGSPPPFLPPFPSLERTNQENLLKDYTPSHLEDGKNRTFHFYGTPFVVPHNFKPKTHNPSVFLKAMQI